MFFCNFILFCFFFVVVIDLDWFDDVFVEYCLCFCGFMEMFIKGFVLLVGCGEEVVFIYVVNVCIMVIVGGEDKLLLVVVVNDELQCKVQKIVEEEGCKVGGCECKWIKEDLFIELLLCVFVCIL